MKYFLVALSVCLSGHTFICGSSQSNNRPVFVLGDDALTAQLQGRTFNPDQPLTYSIHSTWADNPKTEARRFIKEYRDKKNDAFQKNFKIMCVSAGLVTLFTVYHYYSLYMQGAQNTPK